MLVRVAVLTGAAAGLAMVAPYIGPDLMRAATRAAVEQAPPAAVRPYQPSRRTRASEPVPSERRAAGRHRMSIEADTRGHFLVSATVNGRAVDLMFDTGATSVALNEATARRLGIRPRRADYRLPVSTANGLVEAAPVVLPSLRVGVIRVRDVQAVVLPGRVLPVNLLGMSFLGRLSGFRVEGDRLVLSQ